MKRIAQSSVGTARDIEISEANFTHIDAALDEALKQSFPASDPIAVSFPRPVFYEPARPAIASGREKATTGARKAQGM